VANLRGGPISCTVASNEYPRSHKIRLLNSCVNLTLLAFQINIFLVHYVSCIKIVTKINSNF